jgi:3-oxoacyl-[acyl-carrier protein] reductase
VLDGIRYHLVEGAGLGDVAADPADQEAAEDVARAARAGFGHLDVLVCSHARSGGDGDLAALDAALLTVTGG